MASWRERARAVVEATFASCADVDERDLRRALKRAYPFGARRGYPYRVWVAEIGRARRARDVAHAGSGR